MEERDPYLACPVYDTAHFHLRLVQENDAEDLFACYSHPDAQQFFNDDNCTSDFRFSTVVEMRACIIVWLSSYERREYIRFAVLDPSADRAVGTIEMFCDPRWKMTYGTAGGCFRMDLLPEYETIGFLSELIHLASDRFFALFSTERILVKAIPEATARRAALEKFGFLPYEVNHPTYRNYYAKSAGNEDGNSYWS